MTDYQRVAPHTGQRDYANPGNCVKCGYVATTIQWNDVSHDKPPHLSATCDMCYFNWRIVAKDEEQ